MKKETSETSRRERMLRRQASFVQPPPPTLDNQQTSVSERSLFIKGCFCTREGNRIFWIMIWVQLTKLGLELINPWSLPFIERLNFLSK